MMMLGGVVLSISTTATTILALWFGFWWLQSSLQFQRIKRKQREENKATIIGFFHPFCSGGGGGERVLWKAIQALGQLKEEERYHFQIVIYTIDPPSNSYQNDLLEQIKSRFSIEPSKSLNITFIHLNEYSSLLRKANRFSMFVESFRTMKLAQRALEKCVPDVFFDTTGCAFTFFVARILGGCTVCAYVHYPTISTDMLKLVWERRPNFNNDENVANSRITTYIKLIYYTLFALVYGCMGSLASLVMVNSTWTLNHIQFLWRLGCRPIVVYPPCNVDSLINEDNLKKKKEPIFVSIGQFRPEKNHELQIRAFARLLEQEKGKNGNISLSSCRLILVGSCRNATDEQRVEKLRELVESLHLTQHVDFVLNQPFTVVKKWLQDASVGLHTMWNEHFGIGIVEMMAAGLIVIAHNSGGPKSDIIQSTTTIQQQQSTGYLAQTCDEYASCMKRALTLTPDESMAMRRAAQQQAKRFSDANFVTQFKTCIKESKLLSVAS